MPRKYLIVLFLVAFAPPLAGQGLAFADSYTQDGQPCPPECVSDSMEIETYYPSPYGYYEELRGDKIIVGDSDNSYINETDLPPTGTLTFEPKSSAEISNSGKYYEGSIYYDKNDQKFKYYKNSTWQDLGGGNNEPGTVFFSSGSPCPAGSITVGRYYRGGSGGQCTPSGGWVRPGDPAPCCYVEGCGTHSNCSGWVNCASPTDDYLCAKQ